MISREFIVFWIDSKTGEEVVSPDFIKIRGASTNSQKVTLEFETDDNMMVGLHEIGFYAQFEGAEKACAVQVEVKKSTTTWKAIELHSPPRFKEEEAAEKYGLITEQGIEEYQLFDESCLKDDWFLVLPHIIGEENGEQFTIKAELGKASTVISFNPLKKKFTLTNSSETKLDGFYYIVLTLSNKYSQSSRYGMTIHINCPDVEI